MSTHARIGVVNTDGSVTSIYCHFDGYINHTGKMLLSRYNDEAAARQLIALGNLRGIRRTGRPETGHYVTITPEGETEDVVTSKTVTEFDKLREDYAYLFRDGKWFVASRKGPSYHPLDELVF